MDLSKRNPDHYKFGDVEVMHEVIVRNHIEVVPEGNDEEPYGVLSCIMCRQPINAEWRYASCKKCADELDYDFEEDDLNFDAKNGR